MIDNKRQELNFSEQYTNDCIDNNKPYHISVAIKKALKEMYKRIENANKV